MKKSNTHPFLKGGNIMKKLWVLFLVTVIGAIFCLGVSLPAMAGNCGYVVNGDFEVTIQLI
jgi:hypothetical protein